MENLLIFLIGASFYGTIEILWRHYTHWTMLLVGGICLVLLYRAFSVIEKSSLAEKCLLGGVIITSVELFSGSFINLFFHLDVWDYSFLPYNLFGQICLFYSVLWVMLCLPAVFLCKGLKKLIGRL